MPLVNVMVNSRAYTIACDDGEEEHLRDLAKMVDLKAREVLGSVGQVGDARLLLMAALLIADEHHAMSLRMNSASREAGDLAGAQQTLHARLAEAESSAANALEAAATKVEEIAAALARA
jgi:cell division protein ZapA